MSDLDLGDVHRWRDRVLDGGQNQTQEHTCDAWKHIEVFCAMNDLATFFCSPCLLEEKQIEMRIAPAFLQLHRVSIPTSASAHTSAILGAMSEIFLVRGYAQGCKSVLVCIQKWKELSRQLANVQELLRASPTN